MSFHQTVVEGNLGSNPELTQVGDRHVCNFSVAVNEKFNKSDGTEMEITTWYRCSAWNGTARAIAEHKKKGDPILVVGKMRFDKDKENDKIIYPKLNVQFADFISTGRSSGNGSSTQTRIVGQGEPAPTAQEDEIPF